MSPSDINSRVGRLEGRNDGQDDMLREVRVEMAQLRAGLIEINGKLSSMTHDASVTSSRMEDVSQQIEQLTKALGVLSKEEDARKLTYKIGAGVMAVFAAIGSAVLAIASFWPQIKGFLRSIL